MPNTNGDACPGCNRFFRTFDATVQWADKNQWTMVFIVFLAVLGACIGAIIAVAALN